MFFERYSSYVLLWLYLLYKTIKSLLDLQTRETYTSTKKIALAKCATSSSYPKYYKERDGIKHFRYDIF